MPWLIIYLIKCSVCLACLYLFYLLVLRPLTFYHWNRFYLLVYSLISFVLPFVDVTPLVHWEGYHDSQLVNAIPSINTIAAAASIQDQHIPAIMISTWDIFGLLFLSGVLIMLSRFVMQFLSLQHMKRSASIIQQDDIWLYDVSGPMHPFSFGKDIFINSSRHTDDELKKIIQHEFVHVKQQHSIDLIIAELLCIFNWYNPFAWLVRKAIRDNLEFIADHQVLQSGTDAKQYQLLLLKVIGLPQYSITNQFSFSSLKKRIVMMNKIRSAKLHLVKFLFLLPLCAVVLLAFRNKQIEGRKEEQAKTKRDDVVRGLTPGKAMADVKVNVAPGVTTIVSYKDGAIHLMLPVRTSVNSNDTVPAALVTGEMVESILKQLPGIMVDKNGLMTVNGDVKTLNGDVKKVFVDGKEYFMGDGNNGVRRIVVDTTPVPPVRAVKQLPDNVKSIRMNDKQATVTYTDGKVETYNLEIQREKGEFDEKFGAYAPPPPPVPPLPASNPKAPVPPRPITNTPAPPAAPVPQAVPPVNQQIAEIEVNNQQVTIGLKNGKTEYYDLQKSGETGISRMHVKNNTIEISFKNGKTEYYDLDKPEQKAAFHKKYGQFPKAPKEVTLPPVPALPSAAPTPIKPVEKSETNVIQQLPSGEYFVRKDVMDQYLKEARERGEIFIGIDNRLDLSIDDIPNEARVIQWAGGSMQKQINGIYILRPTKQGMTKLLIFKKDKDGSKTHVKTIDLNVKRLPDPTVIENEYILLGRKLNDQ